MGEILNIKCKNCNYEDTFFVGYGSSGAIDLSDLLDELNNKEEASIRIKLDPNELDQSVLTHKGLMQCEICSSINCKIQFSFLAKLHWKNLLPFVINVHTKWNLL